MTMESALQTCSEYELIICGVDFQHKTIHKLTWTPSSKIKIYIEEGGIGEGSPWNL